MFDHSGHWPQSWELSHTDKVALDQQSCLPSLASSAATCGLPGIILKLQSSVVFGSLMITTLVGCMVSNGALDIMVFKITHVGASTICQGVVIV